MGFTFQAATRVLKPCPKCGSGKPKELIRGPRAVRWWVFGLLAVFTAGVGLVLVPLWYADTVHAECPDCRHVFFAGWQ